MRRLGGGHLDCPCFHDVKSQLLHAFASDFHYAVALCSKDGLSEIPDIEFGKVAEHLAEDVQETRQWFRLYRELLHALLIFFLSVRPKYPKACD